MKTLFSFSLAVFFALALSAQTPDPLIQQMLKDMNNDSILYRLNEFTGEKSCTVNGSTVTIKNRVSKKGNDVAADYLKNRMQSFGFTVTDQKYSSGGRNIFAEQKGEVYPTKKYIICGHYDSMADYCADDDASSCSAILETARILSKYKFKYTIVYAFWDEEEQGMVGSKYYAQQAKTNKDEIMGVENVEMLGYDGNNDTKFDIHTKSTSLTLSDKLIAVNTAYSFKLKPNVINPGSSDSDHSSFWNQNYSALCFGEAFFSGDANPSYHKSTDRVNLFNLPYYYELCHLALAAIATYAEPIGLAGISDLSLYPSIIIQAYPTPSHNVLHVNYKLTKTSPVEISLQDIQGKTYKVLLSETKSAGEYSFELNTINYASGMYFLIGKEDDMNIYIQKIIIDK